MFPIITAIATIFVLPILSYLIIRRDQKIDEVSKTLSDEQLKRVENEGDIKVLKASALHADHAVTRAEFENAMNSVQRGIDDIKNRLDRNGV